MDPLAIIEKFYKKGSPLYRVLVTHSQNVAKKAVALARGVPHLNPDVEFIHQASMLHDIGIFQTRAPDIFCTGQKPYLCHGVLGRGILDAEGFPRHALVCERHTGTGISRAEILEKNLPLPARELVPITIEEKIICYSDKYFSKKPHELQLVAPVSKILEKLSRFGPEKPETFRGWLEKFESAV